MINFYDKYPKTFLGGSFIVFCLFLGLFIDAYIKLNNTSTDSPEFKNISNTASIYLFFTIFSLGFSLFLLGVYLNLI